MNSIPFTGNWHYDGLGLANAGSVLLPQQVIWAYTHIEEANSIVIFTE